MMLVETTKIHTDSLDTAITRCYEAWWQSKRLRIYSFAYRRVGDADTAEDITQTVALRTWAELHTWRGNNFDAWAFKIAQNEIYQHFRRKAREVTFTSLEDVEDSLEDGSNLETELLRKERQQIVRQYVEGLPSASSEALILTMDRVEELTIREIARTLGLSESTVKSRLNYGRNKLRYDPDFDLYINHFTGMSKKQKLSLVVKAWEEGGPLTALCVLRPAPFMYDEFARMVLALGASHLHR